MFLLCPVFGDEILQYAARFPDEFFRYLLKYGSLAVRVFRQYNGEVSELTRKYGDQIILYLGLYENKALWLIKKEQPGVVLLSVLPEEFLEQEEQQLFRYGLPGIYFRLFIRHPVKFHEYIGLLGEATLSLNRMYVQLVFWTVLTLVVLYIVRIIYKLLGLIFF